jgi:hypothetical protein
VHLGSARAADPAVHLLSARAAALRNSERGIRGHRGSYPFVGAETCKRANRRQRAAEHGQYQDDMNIGTLTPMEHGKLMDEILQAPARASLQEYEMLVWFQIYRDARV